MAIDLKLPELPKLNMPIGKGKGNKIKKGKIPTKRHINVLPYKKQTFSLAKNWPVIVLIALIVILLGKYFVVDRLTAVARETNRLATIQEELVNVNAQIDSLSDLEDMYAHYTISGMTEEELGRVDRVAAMRLAEDAFLHGNISKSWNLTGNTMTLQVNGSSLQELNSLAAELEENAIVDRCVISSANKRLDEDGNVAVTFIVYLKQPGAEE